MSRNVSSVAARKQSVLHVLSFKEGDQDVPVFTAKRTYAFAEKDIRLMMLSPMDYFCWEKDMTRLESEQTDRPSLLVSSDITELSQ